MPQLWIARSRASELEHILADCDLSVVDASPIQTPSASWRRRELTRGAARVLLYVSEHPHVASEKLLVTVSLDLRRLWRPWSWSEDRRLQRSLVERLRQTCDAAWADEESSGEYSSAESS